MMHKWNCLRRNSIIYQTRRDHLSKAPRATIVNGFGGRYISLLQHFPPPKREQNKTGKGAFSDVGVSKTTGTSSVHLFSKVGVKIDGRPVWECINWFSFLIGQLVSLRRTPKNLDTQNEVCVSKMSFIFRWCWVDSAIFHNKHNFHN